MEKNLHQIWQMEKLMENIASGKKIEVIKRYNNITDDVNIILKLKLPKIEKNGEYYSAIDMN